MNTKLDSLNRLNIKRKFAFADYLLYWEMILVYLLIAINILVMWLRPNLYFSAGTIQSMLQSGMDLSFMSLGMYVMLGQGDRDLSIGGLLLLVSMTIGLLYGAGAPTVLCLLGGLGMAFVGQLISGFLVAVLDISAVIAGIAMASVYRGIVTIVLGINTLTTFPSWFATLSWGNTIGGLVPISLLVFLIISIVFHFTVHKTKLGRQMEVIGCNKTTAQFSGINVTKIRFVGYLIMGVMVWISSVFFIGRLGNGIISSSGMGYELEVMVIANLGRVNIKRRYPKIVSIVLATLVMTCLNYALSLLGVQTNIRKIMTGFVLIISVAISQYKKVDL